MGLFSKRTKSVGQAQSLSPSDASTPSGAQFLNPALIAEAKTQPGGWVYQIELPAGADPDAAIPGSAVKGCWKVNDDVDITGDLIPNPNFVEPRFFKVVTSRRSLKIRPHESHTLSVDGQHDRSSHRIAVCVEPVPLRNDQRAAFQVLRRARLELDFELAQVPARKGSSDTSPFRTCKR